MDFAFLSETFLQLLSGVPLTLNLALVSTALGGILAVLLTLMRMSPVRPLGWTAQFYVFVFRGTPLLVQMFVIYYGLGQFRPTLQAWGLWSFFREPYWCAIFALSLNTAAYASEIILMVKATSLASVITMLEVTGLAAKLISQSYRAVEVFIVAGLIYLVLNFAITRLVAFVEWRLSPHLRPVPTPVSSGAALQNA